MIWISCSISLSRYSLIILSFLVTEGKDYMQLFSQSSVILVLPCSIPQKHACRICHTTQCSWRPSATQRTCQPSRHQCASGRCSCCVIIFTLLWLCFQSRHEGVLEYGFHVEVPRGTLTYMAGNKHAKWLLAHADAQMAYTVRLTSSKPIINIYIFNHGAIVVLWL